MKSLAGKIGRRKSVCAPGQPAHKRTSRTWERIVMRGISRSIYAIYLGCFARRLGTDRVSFESRQDSVRENLLHLRKVGIDVLQ